MRNHWTDKSAIKRYIDLLVKEVARLCTADYDTVRELLEQEIVKRPFSPEEIDELVTASDDDILIEAGRIYSYLTKSQRKGVW
jgi:hypothetical protein